MRPEEHAGSVLIQPIWGNAYAGVALGAKPSVVRGRIPVIQDQNRSLPFEWEGTRALINIGGVCGTSRANTDGLRYLY